MNTASTLCVSIDCAPDIVYKFVSNPLNLPQWAPGLCRSVSKTVTGWVVETTHGPMPLRFVPANTLGVLDHYVTTAPGKDVYVPMRVIANGSGSELLFTVLRLPGMSDADFATDIAAVERDLQRLKTVLEK